MKDKNNFLDFVPVRNSKIDFYENDLGVVTIVIKRNSAFYKILRPIFKIPQNTFVYLDDIGSCVWKEIDGKKSVYDISIKVRNKLSEKAEPLIPRLISFFVILNKNGLVMFS